MARGLSLATGPAVDASVGYQRWIQQAVPSDRKMASRNRVFTFKKNIWYNILLEKIVERKLGGASIFSFISVFVV